MKFLAKSAALAAALAGALGGCADPAPIRLLERAEAGLVAPVELGDETRKALSVDLGSRVELDLDFPEDPVLSFAIGASSRDRPTLLIPVVFRVLVDGNEVFREVVRRAEGEQWLTRVVDLGPWGGKSVRVALEARRGEGGIESAESHVVAHWGNPVVRGRRQRAENAALILISIDCLRADHVGVYGYPRQTTPNLDVFAGESTLYRNAVAVSSYTLPTHASMLTGLPPSLHGAATRRRIARHVDTLPELLASEGYMVLGIVSGLLLSPIYGFAEGFDTYRFSPHRAASLVDQAVELLDEGAGFRRFLFLHLFDAHAPYSPPGEFIERFGSRPKDISRLHSRIERRHPPESEDEILQAKNLYDAEIAYVDRELGRFFAELRERGLYDPSLIVVTADHGEAFYEHGAWEHGRPWQGGGTRLFQEMVHVPLLVKPPSAGEGAVVEDVVSQTDIFATFLEAAGLPGEGPWTRSLLRPFEPGGDRLTLSEFMSTPATGDVTLEVALRRRNLKYRALYRASTREKLYDTSPIDEALHDLAVDPLERDDLSGSDDRALPAFREAATRYLRMVRERGHDRSEADDLSLDPELLEKLESLGYIER